jgi:type IV secretion system protein VirB2
MLFSSRRLTAAFAAIFAAFLTAPAYAQDSYADPAGSGVFVSAVNWLQGTLMGTVATVAAVIAVASVGFMMLTGRIDWRHGATVILGCFVLFGASAIARGILDSATAIAASQAPPPPPPEISVPAFSAPAQTAAPAVADPYAGASVRER